MSLALPLRTETFKEWGKVYARLTSGEQPVYRMDFADTRALTTWLRSHEKGNLRIRCVAEGYFKLSLGTRVDGATLEDLEQVTADMRSRQGEAT